MADLPWFSALPAEQRSQVGLVLQAGLSLFAQWLRYPDQPVLVGRAVFAPAPRDLARIVTLKQTVQLIRVAVDVVEREVSSLASPADRARLEDAVVRYSRELAFAAAEVYASAAEARGAWDARLEAGVVDALVRGQAGERTVSRAVTLGWGRCDWVVALAAPTPADLDVPQLRAGARHTGLSLLVGEAEGSLILVIGGSGSFATAVQQVVTALPEGPVVLGPESSDLVAAASSVQEALAGLAAVRAWPTAPRPVAASALLAERLAMGDAEARKRLLEEVYTPLAEAGGDLLDTAATYLDSGGSIEGTARALFLHSNSVRYRMKKVVKATGRDLTCPRDALVLQLALLVGRSTRL